MHYTSHDQPCENMKLVLNLLSKYKTEFLDIAIYNIEDKTILEHSSAIMCFLKIILQNTEHVSSRREDVKLFHKELNEGIN